MIVNTWEAKVDNTGRIAEDINDWILKKESEGYIFKDKTVNMAAVGVGGGGTGSYIRSEEPSVFITVWMKKSDGEGTFL